MPAVQPAELWQESTRWEKYLELLRVKDAISASSALAPRMKSHYRPYAE